MPPILATLPPSLLEGPDPHPHPHGREGRLGEAWVLIPYLGSKKTVSWGRLLPVGSRDLHGIQGPRHRFSAARSGASICLSVWVSLRPPHPAPLSKSLYFGQGCPAPSQPSELRLPGSFSRKLGEAKL